MIIIFLSIEKSKLKFVKTIVQNQISIYNVVKLNFGGWNDFIRKYICNEL